MKWRNEMAGNESGENGYGESVINIWRRNEENIMAKIMFS
jgi:hypothetical protein